MRAGEIGQMVTPAEGKMPIAITDQHGAVVDWVEFAADNGCYGGKFPGEEKWFGWLDRVVTGREHRCLFVVAPDDFNPAHEDAMGVRSLHRSRPFLPQIRALGVPAALVAQNGLTVDDLDPVWGEFDVLFLGGCRRCLTCGWWPSFDTLLGRTCPRCGGATPEWKVGDDAARLTYMALDQGVEVHIGRVNTQWRWRHAEMIGCSTADGTFLAFGPDKNLDRMRRWPDANLFAAAEEGR